MLGKMLPFLREKDDSVNGEVDEKREATVSGPSSAKGSAPVSAKTSAPPSAEASAKQPEEEENDDKPSQICLTGARKKILPVLLATEPKDDPELTEGRPVDWGRRDLTTLECSRNDTSETTIPGKNISDKCRKFRPSKLTKKQLRRIVPSVDNVCHLVVHDELKGIKDFKDDDIFSPSAREGFIAEQLIQQYCQTTDDPVPLSKVKGKITAHTYLALAFRLGIHKANSIRNLQRIQKACRELGKTYPRLLKSTELIVDCILLSNPDFLEERYPLLQFACTQLRMWLKTIRRGLSNQTLTCIVLEECVSCLYELETYVYHEDRFVAQRFGFLVRSVIVGLSDFATNINAYSNYATVDFISIADYVLVMAMPNEDIDQEIDIMMLPKLEDLDVRHLIGAGGFGAVYKAFYSPIFKEHARPVPCTVKLVAASIFSQLEQAVVTRIVASVTCHPCIVQYLCVYSLEEATIEVMEYIKGLDLQKMVDATRGLGLPEAVTVSAQLLAAIIHLHLHGVIHRDIKASNVLVTRLGRLKLIDFDTAKFCMAHFPNRVVTEYFKRTADEFKDGEKAGTLSYMPPEVFNAASYGRLVDLWAFGVTLYKMLMGQTPFRSANDEKLKKEVCAAKVNVNPKRIYDKEEKHGELRGFAVHVILRLLAKDRRRRLGALSYSEVLGHPFFAKVKWDDLCKKNSLLPLDKYADAFLTKRLAKKTTPGQNSVDVVGLSPIASTASQRRKDILRVETFRGKSICESPILTYISPMFKRIMMGSTYDISEDIPTLRRIGFRRSSITEMRPTREIYAQDILIGSVGDEISGFSSLGLKCEEARCESGKKYFLVTEIEPGSLAEVTSSLIVGDIITHVNGEAVGRVSKLTWNRYPMVSITVLATSTFRILSSFADAKKFFCVPPAVCKVRARRQTWFKKRKEIVARQVPFFLHSARRWMSLFVLWSGVNKKGLVTHGDILLEINGNSLKSLTEQQVNILLSSKSDITVKYLPTSCLRDSRNMFDRFLRFRSTESRNLEDFEDAKTRQVPKMVSFILPIITVQEPKKNKQVK